jgi:cytochrome c peroxidase
VRRLILCTALVLSIIGCQSPSNSRPIGTAIPIHPPLGLPHVPIPAENPPTAQTIALGRMLFYDPRLSVNDSIACASCHNPAQDFTDGTKLSRGAMGKSGLRNAPTILNAAYLPLQFWDGRAPSLEAQAVSPIEDPIEMNQPHDVSVSKLARDQRYKVLFNDAFGPGGVTLPRIENSLASFERTLLSGDSPFDRYQFGGDKSALTPAQIRGLAVFTDPATGNCAACHTIGKTYALFTDGKAHNIGVGASSDGIFDDLGRYRQTNVAADKGAFITPTLRNVANTGPYMHNGSLKTLKDVVDFYAGHGNSNPNLDNRIPGILLSSRDREDLVEFLKSLSGPLPPNVGSPEKK